MCESSKRRLHKIKTEETRGRFSFRFMAIASLFWCSQLSCLFMLRLLCIVPAGVRFFGRCPVCTLFSRVNFSLQKQHYALLFFDTELCNKNINVYTKANVTAAAAKKVDQKACFSMHSFIRGTIELRQGILHSR